MEKERVSVKQPQNPRTVRVRSVILSASVKVFLKSGAHAVTASNVAEKAEVARTTVYRHWPDQRSLLLATIEALSKPCHFQPVVGPLHRDMRLALELLRKRLTTRDVRAVFGALAGYAAQDDAFGDAQRLFVEQLTQPMAAVLRAAQERGDLGDSIDCAFEASLLAGPILHQHLALRNEITDKLIDETAQRWLAAVSQRANPN